jgi:hypothetical protein
MAVTSLSSFSIRASMPLSSGGSPPSSMGAPSKIRFIANLNPVEMHGSGCRLAMFDPLWLARLRGGVSDCIERNQAR